MGVRKHSEEFKKQVIKEAIETGNCSVVGRKYNISPSIVARWVRAQKQDPIIEMTKKALQKDTSLMEDPTEIKKAMEQNVQLKKLLGEKELEIEILRDLLKKMKIPLPPR